MTTVTEISYLKHNQSHMITPRQDVDVTVTSTVKKMPPGTKHSYNNLLTQVFSHPTPKPEENFQKFATSLLKTKALLVPTRLALKRQRRSLKGSTVQYEPVSSDMLQMELGNPEDYILSDRDSDERTTMVSQNIHLLSEQNQMQSTSLYTSPLRDESPYTSPTDISLLYREKPLFSHPVTGHFIVQYAEENGTPSPCSYVLPRKSCREKNAPAFSFGSKCLVERNGGSRTGWQKQWFAHSNPYTTKVDFNRENAWPTPFHYPARPSIGMQASKVSFPAWSIASRVPTNLAVLPEDVPGPSTYHAGSAFRKIKSKNTYITLKSRPGGTQLSTIQTASETPGPGAHDETKFLSNKYSSPKHSFGRRMPTSYRQDPYVNTLPSIEI